MARSEIEPRAWGLGWWWLWLIIILIILFFVWIFAWRPGYNITGTPATGTASRAAPEASAGQLTSIADLPALAGKEIQLQNVPVARVVNDHAFWAGTAGKEVLVVLHRGLSAAVSPGQVVNVTGRVDTLPSLEQARQEWGLTSADIQKLQGKQIYIYAAGVTVRQP